MPHSPAPWNIDGVEIYDADRHHVVWELGNHNQADAQLIAAAPDLLAALKAILKRLINNDWTVEREGITGTAWRVTAASGVDVTGEFNDAERAIAKAEGRSGA